MAKAVFRPGEVNVSQEKMSIDAPAVFVEFDHQITLEEEDAEAVSDVEVYEGPTADDLRKEAEAFKQQWEVEKAELIHQSREQAQQIIKEAEETAFQEVKRKNDEALIVKREAMDEAEKMIADAEQRVKEMETAARQAHEVERKEAEEKGRVAGREAGFAEGKAEVERLIQRTQTVLERAQDKRTEILEETEQEIVDLVLLMARKVIKTISESQKDVVVLNVIQALRKVRSRGNVIIRVNMTDVKVTTEHTKDFVQMLEGVKSIQVQEDSSIESGGCVIETDFGEIDARIASQLAEMEAKILEISPIKEKSKAAPAQTVSRPPVQNGTPIPNGVPKPPVQNGVPKPAGAPAPVPT